jgi:hypothetical protein
MFGVSPKEVATSLGLDPNDRTWGEAIVDTGVRALNAVVGSAGAIASAFDPKGSEDIKTLQGYGEEAMSLKSRIASDEFNTALSTSNLGTQAKGVWEYIKQDPVGTAAEAIGNFVIPGAAIKGVKALSMGAKLSTKAAGNVALGAGAVVGGVMSGGDAAGDAYERVFKATNDADKANSAARSAQVIPTFVGAGASLIGLEKYLAKGVGRAKIIGTGLKEGVSELVDEGTSKLEANRAVAPYVAGTDIMAGVFGSGLYGMAQGGVVGSTGAVVNNISVARDERNNGITVVGYVDKADKAAAQAINGTSNTDTGQTGGQYTPPTLEQQADAIEVKRLEAKQLAAQEQQKANAQQAPVVAAQQQQAAQAQSVQTAQQLFDQFGMKPVLNDVDGQPTGKFVVGEKMFFTENDAVNFAKGLVDAGKDLNPYQQSMVGVLFGGDTLAAKAGDTAKGMVSRAVKFMSDNQLSSAKTMEEAVTRIDQIIENTAPNTDLSSSKPNVDARRLLSLDKLRTSITGEASVRLSEIAEQQRLVVENEVKAKEDAKQAAQAAKDKKAADAAAKKAGKGAAKTSTDVKSQTNTASATNTTSATDAASASSPVTNVSVGQYLAEQANNGGVSPTTGDSNGQQQQQSATGVGTVPVQSGANQDSTNTDGDVRPTSNEPIGAGSVGLGPNGQQNDSRGTNGDEQRTVQPANTNERSTTGQNIAQEVISPNSPNLTGQGDVVGSRTESNTTSNVPTDTGGKSSVSPEVGSSNTGVVEGKRPRGRAPRGPNVSTVASDVTAATENDGRRKGRQETPAERAAIDGAVAQSRELNGALERVFNKVFVTFGGNSGIKNASKKVDFFAQFYLNPDALADTSLPQIAIDMDVPLGTIKSWSAELAQDPVTGRSVFDAKYESRLREAYAAVAKDLNLTIEEMTAVVQANDSVAKMTNELSEAFEAQQLLDEVTGSESGAFAREAVQELTDKSSTKESQEAFAYDALKATNENNDTGLTLSDSPSDTSVSEQFNTGEGISNNYIKLFEGLENAKKKGDATQIEAAQKKLDDFMAKVPKLTKDSIKFRKVGDQTNTKEESDGASEATGKTTVSEQIKAKVKQKNNDAKSGTKALPNGVIKTSKEQYTDLVKDIAQAPAFDALSNKQQSLVTDLAQRGKLNLAAINRIVGEDSVQLSIAPKAKETYIANDLRAQVVAYIGVDNKDKLVVLQSAKDIPARIVKREPKVLTAGGFVFEKRAYLIADNIAQGRGIATFMHEVGGHIGLQQMLGDEFHNLVDEIYEWNKSDANSLEAKLAQAAIRRVAATDVSGLKYENELVAYFIEEAVLAGVKPTHTGKVERVLKKVINAFKKALSVLGMNPQFLTAKDVVNLAYGAAQMELSNKLESTKDSDKEVQLSEKDNLTPAQESRIDRNMERVPGKVRDVFSAYSKAIARQSNKLRFTGQLIEQAAKRIPAAKRYLDLTREQIAIRAKALYDVEKISNKFDALPKPEQRAVNRLLKESTRTGKWAFVPSWVRGDDGKPSIKANESLKEQFDLLSAPAQQTVRDVFANGYVSMDKMRDGATQMINSMYAENIETARRANDTETVADLQKEMRTQLADFNRLFTERGRKPYAPLRRFGNHVVVMRSKEMLDALNTVETAQDKSTPEDVVKEAKKFIRDNEGNAEHYQLHFRESGIAAQSLARSLKDIAGSTVQTFTRDQAAKELYTSADIHGLMYRLRKKSADVVEGSTDPKTGRELGNLLTELHLTLLSEQNARHAEHRRVEGGVEGAEDNMMRAFHSHGMSTASVIAGMHKSKDIVNALEQFEKAANDRTNPNRAQDTALYNEVAARYAVGLDTNDSVITDTVLKYNSAMMLLLKPTYYLQNLMQPWSMTLPVLAGRFGLRAAKALGAAQTEISAVMSGERLTLDTIEKLPHDVRGAVKDLLDSGRLSISLDQDMGNRLRGANAGDKVITKLQGIVERVEGFNRVSTAIAAYRMAVLAGDSHVKAVNYAGNIIYDTHGDYSGANAPRLMRSQVGRVLTQFRKFQLIQIGLLAKLGRESFLDGSLDADEKLIARKALGYTLSTAFAMGGLYALPGVTAAMWILGKVFGSADEPQDPEAQEARLRKKIGNPGVADILLRGASRSVLGMQDGQALGLADWSGMLSLLPYTKIETADRSTYQNILTGLSGAAIGGTGLKMFESMGKFAEGDIAGGLAKALPSGVANIVKAMQLAEKGVTRTSGTQILSPDDISGFTVFLAGLGVKTGEVVDKEFTNRVVNTYEAFYKNESQMITKDYSEAWEKGDSKAMQEARERWSELNDSRKNNGFTPQPFSTLIKSPLGKRKFENKLKGQLSNTGNLLTGKGE